MAERIRRRLAREDGMTLIELLVAAVLIAVGVVSLFTVFDSSRALVTTSEKNDVAAHQGEADLESILKMDYKTVALPSALVHSSTTTNPDWYVQANGSYQWDQSTVSPKSPDPVVVDATNSGLTHISTWSDGQSRLSGSIYRYVTWIDDPNVAGTQNAKRVTIAVTVNNTGPGAAGSLKKPVIVSSVVIDPKAG
jgi:prepilin-type N-terminal cleavage/methylation domain-containing protein